MPENSISTTDKVRSYLAIVIIALVVFGLVAITIIYINRIESTEGIEDLFNSLLPVLSTWIGTILAFYFGKENFESANRQINQLVNKLTPEMYKDIPVAQVMIDYSTMVKYENADKEAVKISDLTTTFAAMTDKSRLPILSKDGHPLFILHKTEYEKLVADAATKDKPLKDFKPSEGYGVNESKGFAIISESSTLKDALAALKSIAGCKDVFVTKNGRSNEPLTGWLPDTRILNFLS